LLKKTFKKTSQVLSLQETKCFFKKKTRPLDGHHNFTRVGFYLCSTKMYGADRPTKKWAKMDLSRHVEENAKQNP